MATSKVLSELYQEGSFTWEVGLTCFITFLVVLRTVLILSQPRTLNVTTSVNHEQSTKAREFFLVYCT